MVLELFLISLIMNDKPPLTLEEKHRRDRRYPRCSIKRYVDSPFLNLYNSGNDQALMNCTAVDNRVFRDLLSLFKPVYDTYTVDQSNNIRKLKLSKDGKPRGRTREVDAVACLGLVLFWYRTRGSCA